MTKTYTQDDVDRMCEIKEQMSELANEVEQITRGDHHTEAYFTEHLTSMINGDSNPHNLDFERVIDSMEHNLEPSDDLRAEAIVKAAKLVNEYAELIIDGRPAKLDANDLADEIADGRGELQDNDGATFEWLVEICREAINTKTAEATKPAEEATIAVTGVEVLPGSMSDPHALSAEEFFESFGCIATKTKEHGPELGDLPEFTIEGSEVKVRAFLMLNYGGQEDLVEALITSVGCPHNEQAMSGQRLYCETCESNL